MSTLRCPVIRYESEPHPDADALELAVIDDWRVCCRIGDFEPGQIVAHIPEKSILPDDLVAEMGLADPPRLAGKANNRVKAIRLRGVVSQGLIYGGDRIAGLAVGDDATAVLGVEKWEPPIPQSMNGVVVVGPQIHYDIENIKAWPDVLEPGEPVVVTEKMHGTLCCLGVHVPPDSAEPTLVASSKGMLGKSLKFLIGDQQNRHNIYCRMADEHGDKVLDAWRRVGSPPGGMFLFGEIVGPKIQDLQYGLAKPEFRLFDARVSGEWVDWRKIVEFASWLGVKTVPVLDDTAAWATDLVGRHTSGKSTVASHVREGVVIRPHKTRYNRDLGRVILKSVNDEYLFRKGGTEYN